MDTSSLGTAAKQLFAALSEAGAGEAIGLEGWLEVLSDAQEVLNTLAAVQAVAMAQVAAFDSDDELGFGPRRHRGLGHVALDAPDLVAARIGCSAQAAVTRMGLAVAEVTSMPALVRAMAEGRVDGFRAGVVADELSDAPPEIRAEVTAALEASGRLTAETAGPLRRSTRRLLARQAPQVLADRAMSERQRRGLHRSTASLGVDHWAAWLPVEASRPAWAAVTTLAQDYLRSGQADSLAQARADALTDLILGQATTTVVLHPTVPLETVTAAGPDADDLVPVGGYGTPGSTAVRAGHLQELASLAGRRRSGTAARSSVRVRVGECLAIDAGTGAVAGILDTAATRDVGPVVRVPKTDAYRPSAQVERLVKARDGRCRFPGCQVSVGFVDLDHVRAYDHDDPAAGGPTASWNLACLCRRHHRIKQRPGWSVVLFADGTMTWTDPSGVSRTTWPDDHRSPRSRRPPTRSDRPPSPAKAAPRPAPPAERHVPPPGSWAAECRAAELEPYSLLEDQFLDVLTGAGIELSPEWGAHRTLPTPARRPPGRCLEDPGVRIAARPDRCFGQTPTQSIVLHPDTVRELEAMVRRRNAPPF